MTFSGFRASSLLAALVIGSFSGCVSGEPSRMSAEQRDMVSGSIKKLVVNTYDLSRPDAVSRLMSLYPTSGPVYSTSNGHVSTTRAELQQQIETFWRYVGSNMRNPHWEWTSMRIDVLAPDAAVLTASYRVPHRNPMNMPHVIAGAWTAVFVNRGGRWVVIQEHLSDAPAAANDSSQAMNHSGN